MSALVQFHHAIIERSNGKIRVNLECLFHAFRSVFPHLAASPSARSRLRELLDRLELEERVELPKGRALWDISALPPLPHWVKLPRETVAEEKIDLRSIPWAPELRFLASVRVFVPLADLLKVQAFFAGGGRTRPLVPIKERSLEIFGDEKRLDILERGSALFGEGRLTLDTLRCFTVAEPLPWAPGPTSDGPLIVIENAATWDSYCRWNAQTRLFSAVVYGCGNRFMDGVTRLNSILQSVGGVRPIYYFGDIDPQGLLIPQDASARAVKAGLPPIEPHLWSYQQLLTVAAGRGQPSGAEPPSSTVCDWLGVLAEPARQLFAVGHRLAQEHVGWELLQGKTGLE